MQARAPNLLVFREDRRQVRGPDLKRALAQELANLHGATSPGKDKVVRALLLAGELECGVADAGSVPLKPYMQVTDRLAESLVAVQSAAGEINFEPGALRDLLAAAAVPDQVEITPAEGFAYYALHPLAFAEALTAIPNLPPSVLVLGIRSIGTTLSAVTAASLRDRGTNAGRITVRPAGHPYNRTTRLSPAELALVHHYLDAHAAFLVVDEGPGLSGSSFLSVAEALVEAGAEAGVVLVCGREPDFDSLCADNAPQRAKRFRWVAVSSQPRKPAGAEVFIGGGEWRRRVFPESSLWPASWTSLERLKYLSSAEASHERLFKFAGLGRYGEQVLEREREVAGAGFGPSPQEEADGFAAYPWINGIDGIDGRPMSAEDLSPKIVERLAAYCAFRAGAFPKECSGLGALEQMAQHNMRHLGFEVPVCLRLERPVLADGRLQPHEWLLAPNGSMVKTDSGSHGDDHFFPGITDIAWDLAGAIVEWRMSAPESEALLECYKRASGDDVRSRVPDFIIAYAAFRSAYCIMAAGGLRGSEEQKRLERAAAAYQKLLRFRSKSSQHNAYKAAIGISRRIRT
jgi:hypothetical protein